MACGPPKGEMCITGELYIHNTYNLMGEAGAIRNKCLRKPLGGNNEKKLEKHCVKTINYKMTPIIINHISNMYNNFISLIHWVCFDYMNQIYVISTGHLEWSFPIWLHHHNITFNVVYL